MRKLGIIVKNINIKMWINVLLFLEFIVKYFSNSLVLCIAESDERNPFDYIVIEDEVEDIVQSFHLIEEGSSEDELDV